MFITNNLVVRQSQKIDGQRKETDLSDRCRVRNGGELLVVVLWAVHQGRCEYLPSGVGMRLWMPVVQVETEVGRVHGPSPTRRPQQGPVLISWGICLEFVSDWFTLCPLHGNREQGVSESQSPRFSLHQVC